MLKFKSIFSSGSVLSGSVWKGFVFFFLSWRVAQGQELCVLACYVRMCMDWRRQLEPVCRVMRGPRGERRRARPSGQWTNRESSSFLLSKHKDWSGHVTARATDLQALSFSFSSVSRIRTWRSASPDTLSMLGTGSSTKAWSCGESPCRSISLPAERRKGKYFISNT